MIFQYLQNKLLLTSAHLHVLFIVLMVLYLILQIIDSGKKSTDNNNQATRPDFILSVMVSSIFGVAALMLTMIIVTFLPESIVGTATYIGELSRIVGNTGYYLMLVASFIGVIPITISGISTARKASSKEGLRVSLPVLAGSILPFYAFIYALMPVNTGILFGTAALAETILLIISLILEFTYGGLLGIIRGLLEYAVGFALFSSALTFPLITDNFFAGIGIIIAVAWVGILMFSKSGAVTSSKKGTIYTPVYEDSEKAVFKSEYGETFTYNKYTHTWQDTLGSICNTPEGLESISKYL